MEPPVETRATPALGTRIRTTVEHPRGVTLVREGQVVRNNHRWYEGEGRIGGLVFDYVQDNGRVSSMSVSSDAWEVIE
jgi:hypothetical protein